MIPSDEIKYWVGFSLIPGIGQVRSVLLENKFGNLKEAWYAGPAELRATGLDSRSVDAIITRRPRISLDDEMEKLERHSVKAIICKDPSYPPLLREIDDHPPILYVRGNLIPEDECSIAIVGTRRASSYGRQTAEEMTCELTRHNITIVSGLAVGIDTVAHRAALKAGGRTIAVAGCGLDIVYPADNAALASQITEHGALISEFPLGTRPRADNFPRRNRIMSGISRGVLVIEAGERSGALITAHMAVEQNREVFAVPGNIYSPASKGTNRLIQEGAKLVRNCADVLEELNLAMVPQQLEMPEPAPSVTDTEAQLLELLSTETHHIDEICRRSGMSMPMVNSMLTILELRGIVKQVGSMNYVLA